MVEWREIPGWDAYQVSKCGRVRRVKPYAKKNGGRPIPYELKCGLHHTGYPYVQLSCNGRRRTCGVHRLIAEAWIPNPEEKPEVAHNDGNRANCHIENLRWATLSENQRDRKRHGTCNSIILKTAGTKNINAILSDEDVISIRRRYRNGETQRSLADEYGIGYSQCSRICRNVSWKWLVPG